MKKITIELTADVKDPNQERETITGTPETIIHILRGRAYRPEILPEEALKSLDGYMDYLEKTIWRLYGIGIKASGSTLKRRASAMVQELHRAGFLKITEGSESK